jgi:endonuclease IV
MSKCPHCGFETKDCINCGEALCYSKEEMAKFEKLEKIKERLKKMTKKGILEFIDGCHCFASNCRFKTELLKELEK